MLTIALISAMASIYGYLLSKYQSKENLFSRLFSITDINKLLDKKRIIKIIIILPLLISGLIFLVLIKDYLYVRKVFLFETIISSSGRISEIDDYSVQGINFITFRIDKMKFTIKKDERYCAFRNLFKNDFIKIDYFREESNLYNNNSIDFEVVKIELIENISD